MIVNINHLRANAFPLKGFLFILDQYGCPVLHPVDCLPDLHLRDGLELPLDGVLELLNAYRHWLEQNILRVAPH